MNTNEVRRAIVAQGMDRLGADLDPGDWASVASVVIRALIGHDDAAPPIREPDALTDWLVDVEKLANATD